jgi:hypothetical protein
MTDYYSGLVGILLDEDAWIYFEGPLRSLPQVSPSLERVKLQSLPDYWQAQGLVSNVKF